VGDFRDAQAGFHVLSGFTTEERLIAFAADDAETSFVVEFFENKPREQLLGFGQFFAGVEALDLGEAKFDEFLPPGLEGEVSLAKRNLILRRVTVLGNEVTGVAGEHEILDFTLPTFAVADQFTDLSKLIGNIMARGFTGQRSILDHLAEILPIRVAENPLKITRQPELQTGFKLDLNEFFQLGKKLGDDRWFHGRGLQIILLTSVN